MRLSIYETLVFCEIKNILITDDSFDFSLKIGCQVDKANCKSFYDKALRLLCTKIELANYKPNSFCKCFLSQYIKSNIDIFINFINYIYKSKISKESCQNYTDEIFGELFLETFRNIVSHNYLDDQYEYLYSLLLEKYSSDVNTDFQSNEVMETEESDRNSDAIQKSEMEINEDIVLKNFYEKHQLKIINGKRYYEYNLATATPVLDETVPYVFRYKDIEIYESTWKKMTIRILEEIDKRNPKTEESLLRLSYWWSKSPAFLEYPKTNYIPFKNIYLNANRSSTHAMMSIRDLLVFYNINPQDCYFVIRRHHVAEPQEVKDYFRKKTIKNFINCMKFRCYSDEIVQMTIKNFNRINNILSKNSSFKDFFLFDDYYYFTSYKNKVDDEAKRIFFTEPKKQKAVSNCLKRLDEYFKNQDFYDSIFDASLPLDLKRELESEINNLFSALNSNVITSGKLYARMKITHPKTLDDLGKFNNQGDLYLITKALFRHIYYFIEPFISKTKEMRLENDDIIISYAYSINTITVNDLNNYSDKMHLKRICNYLELFIDMSKDYVQVEKDKLIRRDCFDIKDESIESINRELTYYVKSFGVINSNDYNGYSSLPSIGMPWNKYLLLGIVRTYLNHTFKICYSGGTYKSFSFTISLL